MVPWGEVISQFTQAHSLDEVLDIQNRYALARSSRLDSCRRERLKGLKTVAA